MTFPRFLAPVAALALTACAWNYEPWIAYADHAAIADPGMASLIGSHARYSVMDDACVVDAPPELVLDRDGKHGTTTFAPVTITIDEPGSACDGISAQANGVYYNGLTDAAYDEVVYRELLAPAEPDVVHTAHLRVR